MLFTEFHKHGQIDVGRFLVRRAFKLYPAFWVMIGVTFLWNLERGDFAPDELRERLWWELLYVQNYNGALWSHTWSLAVEEHFYLGLAALVMVLMRRNSASRDPFAAFLWIVPAAAAFALAARLATVALAPTRPLVGVLYPTHLRVDSLLWGVLIGYLYHFRRGPLLALMRGRLALVLSASVALIAPAFVRDADRQLPRDLRDLCRGQRGARRGRRQPALPDMEHPRRRATTAPSTRPPSEGRLTLPRRSASGCYSNCHNIRQICASGDVRIEFCS